MTTVDTGQVMPIVEHLRELRRRIVRSILAVGVAATLIMVWYEHFKDLLTKPYRDLCASDPSFGCDGSLFSLG
ncbi:MAG: Sec-independent protein translocase protein TatC, partial [Actinomycetota bacterium]